MQVIKVPEGCLKRASDMNLRSETIIYFKLKSIFDHGYFEFGKGVKIVSNKMCLSERSVRRWFNSLHNVGFIYKDSNGYGLVKYDRLYELLGYNISKHESKNRNGKFKIFKISTSHIDRLVTAIAKEEIKLNQSRQEYMIKRKLTSKEKTDNIVGAIDSVSLSCQSVGRLIGGSRSTGQRIEQSLIDKFPNIVRIDRHVEVIGVSDSKSKSGSGHYVSNGLLFKNMPNRIYIY